MLALLLPVLLGLQAPTPPAVPPPVTEEIKAPPAPAPAPEGIKAPPAAPAPVAKATPPAAPAAEAKALSFTSFKLPFVWNAVIPVKDAAVDGLRIDSIYFNKREPKIWPLKGSDFGTRAKVTVTNTSDKGRVPGFAVAVFDAEDRLIGVATGGTKLGSVRAGSTESFDLSFHQVLERIPKGDHFYLSVELTD